MSRDRRLFASGHDGTPSYPLCPPTHGNHDSPFHYLYDFGDGWEHSVKIEGIAPAEPHISYLRLLDANGMRPPEDSGGPWGYAETLEALSDPAHEYLEQALDILGDDYDPNAQPNIEMIHARLQALARKWAPRQRKAK
ncbi:plasmid pRiA4b ORF-3 family protein [Blastomonas sp. CCH5-A3]|uniref:plasmid pRiA4b ORF-3 family protein n=1 Tax=Blastomonas sp. CCH5-A3 TaxID=1768761 RepID=UPI0009E97111|nr:plasmid pRiA4b ORF-3 family protein [Blastomonas sp. CCH5-A3]